MHDQLTTKSGRFTTALQNRGPGNAPAASSESLSVMSELSTPVNLSTIAPRTVLFMPVFHPLRQDGSQFP